MGKGTQKTETGKRTQGTGTQRIKWRENSTLGGANRVRTAAAGEIKGWGIWTGIGSSKRGKGIGNEKTIDILTTTTRGRRGEN